MLEQLTKFNKPYFHLVVGEKSDFQKLYLICEDTRKKNLVVRFIEGSKCTTLDELFGEFAKTLDFPNYFGYNWAAFDECLNDLDWLAGDAYLMILNDIDKIMISLENTFKIFIEILVRSVNEWVEGRNYDSFPTPPTPFHVVFQCLKEKESEVKAIFELVGLRDLDTLNISDLGTMLNQGRKSP